MSRNGAEKILVDKAEKGDIISIAGFVKTGVTDSILDKSIKKALFSRPLGINY
jgi:predicted membrane GTPase involved in stress response